MKCRMRPVVNVRCSVCRRWRMLQRLRGPFCGYVHVLGEYDAEGNTRIVQLPLESGRYTLRHFRCEKCP